MNVIKNSKQIFYISLILCCLTISCQQNEQKPNKTDAKTALSPPEKKPTPMTSEFKNYWYAGKAEVTSYELEQARYGEIRKGKAALIFVTEAFLPEKQVKADHKNPDNIPVLKLNATKNFNTGIYPYSIMQSTFYPVSNNKHALKVSSSIQEWCGHVYTQLNNKNQFEVMSHSYFENEADEHYKIDKTILENELWLQLRINPKSLPTGNLEIIPSLEYTRLKHVAIKPYKAHATLTAGSYKINYPELERTLTLNFKPNFPFNILSWDETFQSGFGKNAKILTTKATVLKRIKTAYWEINSSSFEFLRDTLQLN